MAGFQGHITTSTTLGIGLGFVGHWSGQIPDTSCLLAAGLCSFAGMLPDLDSVKSRQHREIIGFLGAVVAAFTIQRLSSHMAMESATAIACLVYLAIRFGVSWLIRVSTYHRGMFHSIPAAILAGELTFLLITDDPTVEGVGMTATLFKTGAVVLGYLSHLLLDEMCSVASNGKIQIKSSLGTAFKLFGKSALANFGMVILILFLMEPIANRWQSAGNTQIASVNSSSQGTANGWETTENFDTANHRETTNNLGNTQSLSGWSGWSSQGSPSGTQESSDTSPRRLFSALTRGASNGTTSGSTSGTWENTTNGSANGTWGTTDLAGTWRSSDSVGTGREMLPPQPVEDDSTILTSALSAVRGAAGTFSDASSNPTSPTGLVAISPPTQLESVETSRSQSTADSLFSSFRSLINRAASPSGVNSPSNSSSISSGIVSSTANSPSSVNSPSSTSWW